MKIRPQVGKRQVTEHLSQVVQEETGTKMSHGKVNLEAIYDDGSIFVQILWPTS